MAANRGDDLNSSSELYDVYFDKYKIVTDEDEANAYLQPYKIVGLTNQFKQPLIRAFTIIADIYVSKQIGVSQVKRQLDAYLYDRFSLERMDIGSSLSKSEVISEMLQTNGVLFVDFKYLGTNPKVEYIEAPFVSTEVQLREFIDCSFDEILVLSDNVIDLNRQIAGLMINYKIVEGK
jgi:hypothetical protein